MRGSGYVNYLIEPFHGAHRFQNIRLHMANMHTFIFQLKDKILKRSRRSLQFLISKSMPGVVAHTFNPSTREQRQVDLCMFEVAW